MPRPAKRTKLLEDDAGSGDEGASFTINEEYARRFEHNKKREEKHRLEEKYKVSMNGGDDDDDDDDDESTSESEDDDAELATADLDEEIMTTLQAIKNKDPRVYDANVKFYKEFDPDALDGAKKKKEEKPMRLHDYHRKNLLAGHTGGGDDEEEAEPVRTYQQEQDDLKEDLIGSLQAAIKTDDAEESDDNDFLVAKKKQPKHDSLPATTKPAPKITDTDVTTADKDPETYLSNFMAARAWLPEEGSRFQAFDSDDSEEDARADEYEAAYNMRFEDPDKANEKLQSFARDVGKYGVRRDEKSGRKAAREREREKKEAEKRGREEDRARLRKLRIEEAEQKVNKIKEAAGLKGKDIDVDQWRDIIEGDFDDDQWDQEMKRRFGDGYYEADEAEAAADSDVEMRNAAAATAAAGKKKSRKVQKPKWDDDIDIKDLVPDFEGDTAIITLSGDDEEEGGAFVPAEDNPTEHSDSEDDAEGSAPKKLSSKKAKKLREQAKQDAKRSARQTRRKIEDIVDANLPLSNLPSSSVRATNRPTGFRYRATSPTSFGLTPRDILFAEDAQLNEFAGLKKFATWRDEERKARDRKKFSKKARLRSWRKEVFGDAEGPAVSGYAGASVGEGAGSREDGAEGQGDGEGRKKKTKLRGGRRKRKAGGDVEGDGQGGGEGVET